MGAALGASQGRARGRGVPVRGPPGVLGPGRRARVAEGGGSSTRPGEGKEERGFAQGVKDLGPQSLDSTPGRSGSEPLDRGSL